MHRAEEKQQNSSQPAQKEIDELERIRMLENRMRKQGKPSIHNQQSLRSIKSTDSKKMFPQKNNKIVIGEQNSQESQGENLSNGKVQMLEVQIKNNRKITDYFTFKCSAKNSQNLPANQPKQKKPVSAEITPANSFDQKVNSSLDQLKEQNKQLKQKLKIKQESINSFKSNIKKQILDYAVKIHEMQRSRMRQKINHNKVRLGEYYPQKKGGEFWVDGIQMREVKEKIQNIAREKEQLEKNKKLQAKKSNKEYAEDPEEWKNSINSQLYFFSREETHLLETLKRLEEEKVLHIKEFKLLYDEEHSHYGKIDQQTGTVNWPKIAQYQLLSLLGKGGFSEVYKAFDTEELREVACKMHQISPQWSNRNREDFIKHAFREEEVHKMLDHPNIVKLYGTVSIDENAFCTVLQYCEGPDLSYYLKKHKRLPEKQAKMIIRQVINATKYLHQLPQKVIHYDLKPQNILFHKGKVKITDFGLCKITNQDIIELTSQGVGTYWYLPPECFVNDKPAVITAKVDIWSIGVIYFEMLYGEKPFGNQMSQNRILHEGIVLKANCVNFPSTPKCTVSNESKQFIKACLKHQVEERVDIRGALTHPLFEKK